MDTSFKQNLPPFIDAAGASSVGQQRSRNEDQFVVSSLDGPAPQGEASRSKAALLVVADGIGGLPRGAEASEAAVRTIAEHLGAWLPTEGPTPERGSLPGVRSKLASAVRHGHEEVVKTAQDAGVRHIGTTLTLAYLRFPALYLAHLGDSRAYVLRGGKPYRLTHDHTLAEEMSRGLGEEVPADSQWHHILTRALGPSQHGSAEPEILHVELSLHDTLLLCTDGVTKHLSDQRLAKLLSSDERAATLAPRIVDAANAEGGSDNITAVVARCMPDPA